MVRVSHKQPSLSFFCLSEVGVVDRVEWKMRRPTQALKTQALTRGQWLIFRTRGSESTTDFVKQNPVKPPMACSYSQTTKHCGGYMGKEEF